jgi:hypothetical protein
MNTLALNNGVEMPPRVAHQGAPPGCKDTPRV